MSYTIPALMVDRDGERVTLGYAIMADDYLFDFRFPTRGEAWAALENYRADPLQFHSADDMRRCAAHARALPACTNCDVAIVHAGRIVRGHCNVCGTPPHEPDEGKNETQNKNA